jgi:hypothetical protein
MPNETTNETQEDQTVLDADKDESGSSEGEQVENPEQVEAVNVEEQSEILSLDDEPEEENPKPWVNDLRKRYREEQRARKQLEDELKALKTGARNDDVLPEEPTLENPGTGRDEDAYDPDVFRRELRKWYEKKTEFDARQSQKRAQQEELEKEFQARQNAYIDGKKKYKPELIQEAEAEVTSVLSQQRQGMLLDVADDPAALVAVLGASPKTLREVAAIKSDARFIAELVKIQMKLTTKPEKTVPPPERVVSGGGRTPGQSANKLEQLRDEARKSGDYSAYHREKERQGK